MSSIERKKSFKHKKRATDYFAAGNREDSEQLPTFFYNCISFLEDHALNEEGILRIHGRSQDTTAINTYLSCHSERRSTTLGQVDPHAVATLLKNYLNQGPPLLPMEFYSLLIEIGGKPEMAGESLLSLRDIISIMPLSHQRVLHRVMIFIDRVRQHSSRNKMDAKALAVIFNPLLLRAPSDVSPAQILSQTQSCISCVLLLLDNYTTIFEGLGMNYVEMPTSPPIASRDGSREASAASSSKDKIKIRFLFNFKVKTGGCIQNTVSLFLKYAKQGVKRETGQTKAVVCTNPMEVAWDEVVPLEVTLTFNKRTKSFESRSIIVTLKCVTTKGTKTLGAAAVNLAEISAPTLALSVREELKMYDMLHKGGKSKGMTLQVKSHSEWRKVNNKLVVKQEESSGTQSIRRHSFLGGPPPEDSVSEISEKKNVTLKQKPPLSSILSMPNLHHLDSNRTERIEEDRYPLSARDQYTKEDSANGITASSPTSQTTPEHPPFAHPVSPSPSPSPPSSPTSQTSPSVSQEVPIEATIEPVVSPRLATSIPISLAANPTEITATAPAVTPSPTSPRPATPTPNHPSKNDASSTSDKNLIAPAQVRTPVPESENPTSQKEPVLNELEIAEETRELKGEDKLQERDSTTETKELKDTETGNTKDHAKEKEIPTAIENDKERSKGRDLDKERGKGKDHDRDQDKHRHSRDRGKDKDGEKSKRRSPDRERAKDKEQGREKARHHEREIGKDRPKGKDKEVGKTKEVRPEKEVERTPFITSDDAKSKDSDSSDSPDEHTNGIGSGKFDKHLLLSSPEPIKTPTKRERGRTIGEIHLHSLEYGPPASPTLKEEDADSDETDNDFEGTNMHKFQELIEQIETLQQQKRQLELETFHLRRYLLHNEIYRPLSLEFSERGISSTAEQIIENLLKMNCFQEPHNFLPSFFDNIIISLQQESKNEVEIPKNLHWLSTTLGLLYLLRMSLRGIPDPSVLGVTALIQPIQVTGDNVEAYEKANSNLLQFARGVQATGLELYLRVLKIFEKQLDEEKLVLAFIGRPKEKEEKRHFTIKEKTLDSLYKIQEPVLTPALALKEILREIGENHQLLKNAKIFDTFAWHLVLHRLFCLDHLLIHELSTQKKLFSTDANILKQATSEVEQLMREKFPSNSSASPLKMTNQFVSLVTAEYNKLDSETYISNSFNLIKPSQILQILEVLRPDKDSRKPVPGGVLKVLQSMVKSEADKPRVVPMTWHLSDEFTKLQQAVH